MRVLIKVFWLVTYGARPFMQTHPRFPQQVFPKHNTKHFSVTACGGKKDVFLLQLQGTTHACSEQQEAERQSQLAAILPASSPSSLPTTAHAAPIHCRKSSPATRAEENPNPWAQVRSVPGLLLCPTWRETFHALSCPCVTQSQKESKCLQSHLILNRLLSVLWT